MLRGKTNGKENQGIPDQIRLIQEELSELRDQISQQKNHIISLEALVMEQQQEIESLREELSRLIDGEEPPQEEFSIYGKMEDAEGNPFVSGLTMKSNSGRTYQYNISGHQREMTVLLPSPASLRVIMKSS